MPSSLTVSLSSALVFSTRPPVSVSGTGRRNVRRRLRIFSGVGSARRCRSPRRAPVLSGLAPDVSSVRLWLPPLNAPFRRRADASLLRLRSGSVPPGRGILTACPSALPFRGGVRSRLTLNRLALFRNPWSYGDGVSRPICRYLYLHLLFRNLHRASRRGFADGGMLPYRSIINMNPTSSAPDLCPIIIHAGPLD